MNAPRIIDGTLHQGPTVGVMWTCHACGVTDKVVHVRAPDEDVIHWVEGVRELVGASHWATSPQCPSRQCDLKIPLRANPENDPTVRIGEAQRQ